jgi:hypothetical protein
MQQPSVGRIIHVIGGPAHSNGAETAPAVITRVWSQHPAGGWVVNATVFPDASLPLFATSVRLRDTEEEARGHLPSAAAYWPPRV